MKTHDNDNARSAQRQAASGHTLARSSAVAQEASHDLVSHSPRLAAQQQRLGAAFGPVAQRVPNPLKLDVEAQGMARLKGDKSKRQDLTPDLGAASEPTAPSGQQIQCKSLIEAVGRAGTDKIAVAGEIHGEINRNAEERFWADEGTKIVYENEIHNLKSPESEEETVPMTFDDCAERALYDMETTIRWIKDFDYRKKGLSKGEKCDAADSLKQLIVTHADLLATKIASAKVELRNMNGFNAEWEKRKLPPRYSQAQIEATSAVINFIGKLCALCVKTLSYEYVATDALVAGLRIKKVGEYVDEAEDLFFKAKSLANIDKTRLMSVARSETMYLNLRELGDFVSEKSIYKVGNKHAVDMKKIPDPVVEIKSREEYLAETRLIESPNPENITRPPAEDMLSGNLIEERKKKAAKTGSKIEAL